ncbi:YraN family protein [Natronoglycomyces albus]|uniref:UPF0102 protein JQS30_04710 n=1 Tax=Natronoglycomyces albus TaxID=2811108 RepID=A0A895XUL2_9ACTN|nr:YraN family protein [Natronoglycomyces albus]QSB06216.1 YraN family protein [Natronoglycomyces albus]
MTTPPIPDLGELSPFELGVIGERFAADHLRRDGIRILECNWREAAGEIDLIARHRDTIVFCEVKTRRSLKYGPPSAAIDAAKASQLVALAQLWLKDRATFDQPWRIDHLLLRAVGSHELQLEHLRGPRQCRTN